MDVGITVSCMTAVIANGELMTFVILADIPIADMTNSVETGLRFAKLGFAIVVELLLVEV